MEKPFKIKTPDGHVIVGVLNTPSKNTSKAIVFVHGLAGNCNEHIFYNAARYFPSKGFATIRFNQYDSDSKARDLDKTTVALQGKDLNTVIKHFSKEFKEIQVVGHSLGGPTILSSKPRVCKIVLWDPTFTLKAYKSWDIDYCKELDKYIANWGIRSLIGKKMISEFDRMQTSDALLKRIKVPVKIILAGKGILWKSWEKAFKKNKAITMHATHIIKHSTHCFDEEGAEEELFLETLKFLKN